VSTTFLNAKRVVFSDARGDYERTARTVKTGRLGGFGERTSKATQPADQAGTTAEAEFPRFAIVLVAVADKGKSVREEKKPEAKAQWTRQEKISFGTAITAVCALVVAIVAGAGTLENSRTSVANRQDRQAETEETKRDKNVDARIGSALNPIKEDLARKASNNALKESAEGTRKDIKEGFDGIRGEIKEISKSVQQTQLDVAKMAGRMDRLEKNVDDFLPRRIAAAAALPPAALASDIPNLKFLYALADDRKVQIANETSNLLREKLALVETSQPDFWSLAATVITRVSRAAINENLSTSQRIQNVFIHGNTFHGALVVLDGIHFIANICEQCVVQYDGGPTDVRNNLFVNCLFVVSLKSAPPQAGHRVIEVLQTSNLKSVAL
jgi:hypothetical protein